MMIQSDQPHTESETNHMPKIRVAFEVEVPYGLMESIQEHEAMEELEDRVLDHIRSRQVEWNWEWV